VATSAARGDRPGKKYSSEKRSSAALCVVTVRRLVDTGGARLTSFWPALLLFLLGCLPNCYVRGAVVQAQSLGYASGLGEMAAGRFARLFERPHEQVRRSTPSRRKEFEDEETNP